MWWLALCDGEGALEALDLAHALALAAVCQGALRHAQFGLPAVRQHSFDPGDCCYLLRGPHVNVRPDPGLVRVKRPFAG
jgi:hypothetical protein